MEQRRAALIATALELFRQRPFSAVSTEEVARTAGVSQSLIFHYFPTKADLYVAAFQQELEVLWERISEASGRSDEPLERLLGALHAYFDFFEQGGDRFLGMLRGGQGALIDGTMVAMIESLRDRLVGLMLTEIAAVAPEGTLGEPRLLRAGLRGWFGLVQELAVDRVDKGDLTRDELIEISLRTLAAALPQLEAVVTDGGKNGGDAGP